MHARDLFAGFPTVRPDSPVIDAARSPVEWELPGLIVVDDGSSPVTTLPRTQVPGGVGHRQDDPAPALDEDGRLVGAVTLKALLRVAAR
ncbi:hypothetical protein ACWEPC_01275 [Nonomuraea sp. NPDC004297]